MAHIYILKILQFPKDRIYEGVNLISKERKIKINRYKFVEDSYRSLIAELLVRYAIINNRNYKNNELIFCTTKFGKPYLKNQNKKFIYFNFSHSEKYVVCVIDNEECGIDIENIRNYSIDIANHAFHEYEIKKLNHYDNDKDAAKYFTFLWTMKEAYLKALGVGFSKALSSFYILEDKKISIIDNEIDSRKFNVFQTKNIEEYVMSYVGNSKAIYHYINDVELIKYIKQWKY